MTTPDGPAPSGVSFQLTAEDFVAAQRLHAQKTARYWMSRAAMLFVVLLAFAVVARGTDNFDIASELGNALVGTIAISLFVLAFWLWGRFRLSSNTRRNYAHYPLAQRSGRLGMLPDGLQHASDRGNITVLWRDLIAWRGNAKVVLLYTSPNQFLVVPSRLAEAGFPIGELKAVLAKQVRQIGGP